MRRGAAARHHAGSGRRGSEPGTGIWASRLTRGGDAAAQPAPGLRMKREFLQRQSWNHIGRSRWPGRPPRSGTPVTVGRIEARPSPPATPACWTSPAGIPAGRNRGEAPASPSLDVERAGFQTSWTCSSAPAARGDSRQTSRCGAGWRRAAAVDMEEGTAAAALGSGAVKSSGSRKPSLGSSVLRVLHRAQCGRTAEAAKGPGFDQ